MNNSAISLRYFKTDGKPGRPPKKDREVPFEYPRFVANEQKRSISLKASKDHYTPSEWLELVYECVGKCLRCGNYTAKLTADHIIPLTRGGSDGIENIQPLCKGCNSRKGTKTIDYRPGFAFEII